MNKLEQHVNRRILLAARLPGNNPKHSLLWLLSEKGGCRQKKQKKQTFFHIFTNDKELCESDAFLPLHHSGTTTSHSHILFPFPFSPFLSPLPRPLASSDTPDSALNHFDFEHQQLDLDRLRHRERHLPALCGGRKSASDAEVDPPNARWATARSFL